MSNKEDPVPFAQFLRDLGYGDAHRELSEELHALVSGLQDAALHQGNEVVGTLSLTIKVKLDPRGHAATAYEIKRKDARNPSTPTVFFVTKGGNLSTQNPRQTAFDLREVSPRNEAVNDLGEPVREVRDV